MVAFCSSVFYVSFPMSLILRIRFHSPQSYMPKLHVSHVKAILINFSERNNIMYKSPQGIPYQVNLIDTSLLLFPLFSLLLWVQPWISLVLALSLLVLLEFDIMSAKHDNIFPTLVELPKT